VSDVIPNDVDATAGVHAPVQHDLTSVDLSLLFFEPAVGDSALVLAIKELIAEATMSSDKSSIAAFNASL
jgi:MinD superfamily P-loop ATPase